jgi:ribonuclease Y
MASELGLDPKVPKRAGLLHDIGKAIDHEVEGSHALIGAELAKRLGEANMISHAIEAHHAEVEIKTIEAVLVQAADAISAARPGARRETLESYIKRLEKLETLADSFPGVEKAYAMQAGREIRIVVQSEAVDDLQSVTLARDIAREVEEQLDYPGQIKITVIRETRVVEYAK